MPYLERDIRLTNKRHTLFERRPCFCPKAARRVHGVLLRLPIPKWIPIRNGVERQFLNPIWSFRRSVRRPFRTIVPPATFLCALARRDYVPQGFRSSQGSNSMLRRLFFKSAMRRMKITSKLLTRMQTQVEVVYGIAGITPTAGG